MASIKCGNCGETHGSVQEVKDCHLLGKPVTSAAIRATQTRPVEPATMKQTEYAKALAAERPNWHAAITDGNVWERCFDLTCDGSKFVSKDEASAVITALRALPKEQVVKAEPTGYAAEAKRGDVHVVGNTYYRIHIAQKSGKAYAAKANIIATAQWTDGVLVNPGVIQWEYVQGFIHKLSTSTLTTAEQAAAFGHLVGRCCFCSHAIDTPESTAVGYGPVCAAKYDLPWGAAVQAAPSA